MPLTDFELEARRQVPPPAGSLCRGVAPPRHALALARHHARLLRRRPAPAARKPLLAALLSVFA